MTIIFDMDGVLVDTEPAVAKAGIILFDRIFNIAVTAEDFRPFIGTGESRYIGGVCEKFNVPYDESLKHQLYEIYFETIKEHLGIFDETIGLLKKLRQDGFKTALASSADRVKIDANLTAAEIDLDLFDRIVGGGEVKNKKPAPDIYLKTAELLGVSPDTCIVVEDALNGVEAAKAAGMKCIGFTSSFTESQLLSKGADKIAHPNHLYEAIMAFS